MILRLWLRAIALDMVAPNKDDYLGFTAMPPWKFLAWCGLHLLADLDEWCDDNLTFVIFWIGPYRNGGL